MQPGSNYWYVVKTKPRAEKKASEQLRQAGIENFVPLKKQLRQWSDRRKWVYEPLISSYLFVNANTKNRAAVFCANGVLNFLSENGKPALVHDMELEYIRKLCDSESDVAICPRVLEAGDYVAIQNGPLKGLTGILVVSEKGNRLRVTLKGLSIDAVVEIGKTEVRFLN